MQQSDNHGINKIASLHAIQIAGFQIRYDKITIMQ